MAEIKDFGNISDLFEKAYEFGTQDMDNYTETANRVKNRSDDIDKREIVSDLVISDRIATVRAKAEKLRHPEGEGKKETGGTTNKQSSITFAKPERVTDR